MGGRSLFANVMLCVIAVILAVGFYLGIDAMSVVKISQETLTDDVPALRDDLAQLECDCGAGGRHVGCDRDSQRNRRLRR